MDGQPLGLVGREGLVHSVKIHLEQVLHQVVELDESLGAGAKLALAADENQRNGCWY